MEVYWLEQNERDVPSADDWLGPRELLCLDVLHAPKRRSEWRLGRWTAKCAIAAYLRLSVDAGVLANIEIRPEPSGAPQVFLSGKVADVAISISHSTGRAICAVAGRDIRLGCDLEIIEPRAAAFLEDYFTKGEQALVAQAPLADRPQLITFLWSGKESALKAMKHGLRVDTRSVIVRPSDAPIDSRWARFEVRSIWGDSFHGWRCEANRLLRTIVTDIPSAEPIFLPIPRPVKTAVSPAPAAGPQRTNFVSV